MGIRPEEVQREDAPEVDEVRRRPDVVWPKLVRVTEAELEPEQLHKASHAAEQVDRHEGKQHETSKRSRKGYHTEDRP